MFRMTSSNVPYHALCKAILTAGGPVARWHRAELFSILLNAACKECNIGTRSLHCGLFFPFFFYTYCAPYSILPFLLFLFSFFSSTYFHFFFLFILLISFPLSHSLAFLLVTCHLLSLSLNYYYCFFPSFSISSFFCFFFHRDDCNISALFWPVIHFNPAILFMLMIGFPSRSA